MNKVSENGNIFFHSVCGSEILLEWGYRVPGYGRMVETPSLKCVENAQKGFSLLHKIYLSA